MVIDRDRLKAALGEYPEGRDVFLSASLADNAKLPELLREAQNYVINVSDGSTPYAKAAESCWQRIDAALKEQS